MILFDLDKYWSEKTFRIQKIENYSATKDFAPSLLDTLPKECNPGHLKAYFTSSFLTLLYHLFWFHNRKGSKYYLKGQMFHAGGC